MDEGMGPLVTIVRLNTRLFLNCLEDVSDQVAMRRSNGTGNSIAFLALHVLDARYFLCRLMGLEAQNPYAADLESVRSVGDLKQAPPVAEIKRHWEGVSRLLEGRLSNVTREELGSKSTMRFPVEDDSLIGAVSFLVQHESYHIGQMSMVRSLNSLAPMRY